MSDRYRIEVRVEPGFAPEHSDAQQARFLFVYAVTIINAGEVAARLLSRHWIITDANGKVEEVKGEGVVGEQPLIEPGEAFEYSSFCSLETEVGCMQGSYQMRAVDGTLFEAEIAPFTLAVPGSLN